MTGEVVFHLRVALEDLVYHLVWHDRGSPSNRSHFPVVSADRASEWSRIVKDRLPGVAAAHVAKLRRLQPFAGCIWTKRLADLSNVDKHRSPIQVAVSTGARFSMESTSVMIDPDDPEWCIVDTTPVIEVRTHDREPLHATLTDLCFAVAETLKGFSTELPGGDHLQISQT